MLAGAVWSEIVRLPNVRCLRSTCDRAAKQTGTDNHTQSRHRRQCCRLSAICIHHWKLLTAKHVTNRLAVVKHVGHWLVAQCIKLHDKRRANYWMASKRSRWLGVGDGGTTGWNGLSADRAAEYGSRHGRLGWFDPKTNIGFWLQDAFIVITAGWFLGTNTSWLPKDPAAVSSVILLWPPNRNRDAGWLLTAEVVTTVVDIQQCWLPMVNIGYTWLPARSFKILPALLPHVNREVRVLPRLADAVTVAHTSGVPAKLADESDATLLVRCHRERV